MATFTFRYSRAGFIADLFIVCCGRRQLWKKYGIGVWWLNTSVNIGNANNCADCNSYIKIY